jgi:trehalose-6-phosphate synthase
MRIPLRVILSVFIVIGVIVVLFTVLQVQQEKERMTMDLEGRASVLGESLKESVDPLVAKGQAQRLQTIVEKFGNREKLAGVAVYDAQDKLVAATVRLAPHLKTPLPLVGRVMSTDQEGGAFSLMGGRELYLYALPLYREKNVSGALVIFYETKQIKKSVARIWESNFIYLLVSAVFISLTILVVIRWSMVHPIARMADWMKSLRTEKEGNPLPPPPGRVFEPLAREATRMVRSISEARSAAEQEARLRRNGETFWTPVRLREHVRNLLRGRPLFVVSNREPYVHERQGKKIEYVVPASGLVTALEPILQACGGTWVAHGSGDADREVVDDQNQVGVPPEDPQYILKRVWLTKEEEEGYYYGFANEGLWPLCHIAHTRPTFRAADWNYYEAVNWKFALATLEKLESSQDPWVLVQDYHFALLPRMIKGKRPDARVALFWHIPWPNPESFGICPWQREILHGMLGADLIGFHVQFHCNNFLETVDRALESRIDWENFTVERENHLTQVKPFPISIASPAAAALSPPLNGGLKKNLLRELGIQGEYLGVGVDRVDYTKGLRERFLAIERFLEKYPPYQGKFTFVELAAPSRTHIKEYRDLVAQVETEAERINWRFQTKEWKPIVFLKRHHSHKEIAPFYEAADLCLVTSLHDGMNLVAKEFIGAKGDESGVLILSQFTGASRELKDALIVNPYDTEQMAEAIRGALEMDPEERKARMQRMREAVNERNIYRWAGDLLSSLSRIRLSAVPPLGINTRYNLSKPNNLPGGG